MQSVKEFLEQYEIDFTQPLDQKGQSSVYKTTERTTGQIFVVKSIEIHPNFDQLAAIETQYQKAMSLSHPNLMPYKGVYRFESTDLVKYFILMPYLEIDNLARLIQEDLLSKAQKRDIIASLLELLCYLHQNGILLQNLSANHLLIKKVDDICLPLLINYGAEEPLELAFFTNYEYLAPEQLDESRGKIDQQSDIWALGVLLYELFTKQLPFGRKTAQSPNRRIEERILNEEVPNLIEEIPEPYRHILRKCLVKDKSERWATAQEMLTYLKENPFKSKAREAGILETFEYMGAEATDLEEEAAESGYENQEHVPILQRKFKRKPSKPISWFWVLIYFILAAVLGYYLSKL